MRQDNNIKSFRILMALADALEGRYDGVRQELAAGAIRAAIRPAGLAAPRSQVWSVPILM